MAKKARRFVVVSSVVVVLAVIVAGCSLLKLSYYRIKTGSMEPVLPVGTIVITSGAIPLQPHRAVTFKAGNELVTHVLVGYAKNGSLITRGIANAANDVWQTPVYPPDVRGSVVARVLLFTPGFWMSKKGVVALAGMACILLALYFMNQRASPYARFSSSSK